MQQIKELTEKQDTKILMKKLKSFVDDNCNMEVITMDSKVYKDLVGKIQRIADFVAKAQVMPKEENEVWLDSNQVADALNISTRTLQRLRNENLISYSMLRGRCLYKLSEIERGLNERIIKCKPQDRENFRRNYFLNDNENE